MMATQTKILITGFEPFNGLLTNPSEEVARIVKQQGIKGVELYTLVLPVGYHRAMTIIREQVSLYDAVVMLGLARTRQEISIERVALNLMDATSKDNCGFKPNEELINQDGPVAYWTTFPVKEMTVAIKDSGIPCKVSNSAGTYVCNAVFYAAIDEVTTKNIPTKVVFIHLPSEKQMSLETMAQAVRVGILTFLSKKDQ